MDFKLIFVLLSVISCFAFVEGWRSRNRKLFDPPNNNTCRLPLPDFNHVRRDVEANRIIHIISADPRWNYILSIVTEGFEAVMDNRPALFLTHLRRLLKELNIMQEKMVKSCTYVIRTRTSRTGHWENALGKLSNSPTFRGIAAVYYLVTECFSVQIHTKTSKSDSEYELDIILRNVEATISAKTRQIFDYIQQHLHLIPRLPKCSQNQTQDSADEPEPNPSCAYPHVTQSLPKSTPIKLLPTSTYPPIESVPTSTYSPIESVPTSTTRLDESVKGQTDSPNESVPTSTYPPNESVQTSTSRLGQSELPSRDQFTIQSVPTSTYSPIESDPTSTTRLGQSELPSRDQSTIQSVPTSTYSPIESVPTSTTRLDESVKGQTDSPNESVPTSTYPPNESVQTSTSRLGQSELPSRDQFTIQSVPTSTYSPIESDPTSTTRLGQSELPSRDQSTIQSVPTSTYSPIESIPTSTSRLGQSELPSRDQSTIQSVPTSTYSPIESVPTTTYRPGQSVPTSSHRPDITLPDKREVVIDIPRGNNGNNKNVTKVWQCEGKEKMVINVSIIIEYKRRPSKVESEIITAILDDDKLQDYLPLPPYGEHFKIIYGLYLFNMECVSFSAIYTKKVIRNQEISYDDVVNSIPYDRPVLLIYFDPRSNKKMTREEAKNIMKSLLGRGRIDHTLPILTKVTVLQSSQKKGKVHLIYPADVPENQFVLIIYNEFWTGHLPDNTLFGISSSQLQNLIEIQIISILQIIFKMQPTYILTDYYRENKINQVSESITTNNTDRNTYEVINITMNIVHGQPTSYDIEIQRFNKKKPHINDWLNNGVTSGSSEILPIFYGLQVLDPASLGFNLVKVKRHQIMEEVMKQKIVIKNHLGTTLRNEPIIIVYCKNSSKLKLTKKKVTDIMTNLITLQKYNSSLPLVAELVFIERASKHELIITPPIRDLPSNQYILIIKNKFWDVRGNRFRVLEGLTSNQIRSYKPLQTCAVLLIHLGLRPSQMLVNHMLQNERVISVRVTAQKVNSPFVTVTEIIVRVTNDRTVHFQIKKHYVPENGEGISTISEKSPKHLVQYLTQDDAFRDSNAIRKLFYTLELQTEDLMSVATVRVKHIKGNELKIDRIPDGLYSGQIVLVLYGKLKRRKQARLIVDDLHNLRPFNIVPNIEAEFVTVNILNHKKILLSNPLRGLRLLEHVIIIYGKNIRNDKRIILEPLLPITTNIMTDMRIEILHGMLQLFFGTQPSKLWSAYFENMATTSFNFTITRKKRIFLNIVENIVKSITLDFYKTGFVKNINVGTKVFKTRMNKRLHKYN